MPRASVSSLVVRLLNPLCFKVLPSRDGGVPDSNRRHLGEKGKEGSCEIPTESLLN
jgi:hypothetical protein